MVHVQFLPLGFCGSFVLYSMQKLEFLIFFGLNFSNSFPVKTYVFGKSFIFCTSFTDGALSLHLRVVALPSSVTMSWPAETTEKLNRSGLDFLVLVLQNSNCLNLNAFFNFASLLYLPGYMVHVQLLPLWSCGSFALFSMRRLEFLTFLVWNFQTVFPLNPLFSECPSFFLLFVPMGLWICTCAW